MVGQITNHLRFAMVEEENSEKEFQEENKKSSNENFFKNRDSKH